MKAAGQDSAEARAKVKEWTAKKRDFLQNRVDLPLVKSQNGGIMRLRGDPVTISSIESPLKSQSNKGTAPAASQAQSCTLTWN